MLIPANATTRPQKAPACHSQFQSSFVGGASPEKKRCFGSCTVGGRRLEEGWTSVRERRCGVGGGGVDGVFTSSW